MFQKTHMLRKKKTVSSIRTFGCPHCKSRIRHFEPTQVRHLDLTYYDWSDGYREFPYLPACMEDAHPIARCSACSGLFRNDEVVYENEKISTPELVKGQRHYASYEKPTAADYLNAIRGGVARSEQEKIEFCKIVWHKANDRIRRQIRYITENCAFLLHSEAELNVYIEEIEQYFIELEKYEQARVNDGELLESLISILRWEAPQLLTGEGEAEISRAFERGINDEQRSHLIAYVCAFFGYLFPEVPGLLQGLYLLSGLSSGTFPRSYVLASSEYVIERITETRHEIKTSLFDVLRFHYTTDERQCLFHLARLLRSNNHVLAAELLRETGAFDHALSFLNRGEKLENERGLPIDAIRWACEQRLPYVFEVGKEKELGEVLRLIKQASN